MLPPYRGDDSQAQLAAGVQYLVSLEIIFIDRRILDGGDAIPVQQFDCIPQGFLTLGIGCWRYYSRDQIARAFLETADRHAGLGIAIDAPIRGIARLVRNVRKVECLSVRPSGVTVSA